MLNTLLKTAENGQKRRENAVFWGAFPEKAAWRCGFFRIWRGGSVWPWACAGRLNLCNRRRGAGMADRAANGAAVGASGGGQGGKAV